METNEEEQEQAIVTSSSSPNSIVDALDSEYTHITMHCENHR